MSPCDWSDVAELPLASINGEEPSEEAGSCSTASLPPAPSPLAVAPAAAKGSTFGSEYGAPTARSSRAELP